MTLIGKWALLTVKFILEDVHGSSDHPSFRPKRISSRTYIYSNKFPDSYVLLLWQMSRRMHLAARGLGSVSFFDRKKSRWRPLRLSCVLFYRLFICFSLEVTNEQHVPLCERSLFTQPNRLYVLGTEWWCFKAKCQSVHPKGLLAWNRVSLSKQVPTRIGRKGGFLNFFSALVFVWRRICASRKQNLLTNGIAYVCPMS